MTDEPCTEETWSWNHFTPNQVDPYWIRCSLVGTHDEHEDSNTGLTWSNVKDSGESEDSGAQPVEAADKVVEPPAGSYMTRVFGWLKANPGVAAYDTSALDIELALQQEALRKTNPRYLPGGVINPRPLKDDEEIVMVSPGSYYEEWGVQPNPLHGFEQVPYAEVIVDIKWTDGNEAKIHWPRVKMVVEDRHPDHNMLPMLGRLEQEGHTHCIPDQGLFFSPERDKDSSFWMTVNTSPPKTVEVVEWQVTGKPGTHNGVEFPDYSFIWSDAKMTTDRQASGETAEEAARHFLKQASNPESKYPWAEGPFLKKRIHTYTEWEEAPDA